MPTTNEYFLAKTTLVAAPNDANDGRDRFGFNLATASWTQSTKRLAQTGAFSGYTHTAGDSIYLDAVGSGVAGLYEISSKVDNDTIELVEEYSAGNETNVTSSDGPWATMQSAIDTMSTNGSVLNICADGTYAAISDLNFDTNTGGDHDPLTYRGVNTRGVHDGTKATISGASVGGTEAVIEFGLTNTYAVFCDLLIDGDGGAQDLVSSSSIGLETLWVRCRFTGSARDGIRGEGPQTSFHLVDCEIDNCTGWGIWGNGNSRPNVGMIGCSVHDNGSGGVRATVGYQSGRCTGAIIDSIFYDNGGVGLYLWDSYVPQHAVVMNCTFFGNTSHGLQIYQDTSRIVLRNLISRSNGGYGLQMDSGDWTSIADLRACCFHNNTSGATNVSGGVPDLFSENLAVDPQFISETDGSEDFTLYPTSPCHDAAIGGPTS